MDAIIRRAEARDVPAMLELVRELATFEKEPEAVTVTEAEMLDAGFGEKPVWWGWVAERSGDGTARLVGIAVCYERYSTWRGRVGYLEDIVVTESARGQRVGERLFRACVQDALDRGYHHLTWQVLDWNKGAMRFYARLGAEFDTQWENGRMTREVMSRLMKP
ncbi:MAG: GNAT family N-acetyltransferase [Flavobacteriales bacterium]|nr:GNAT family N-acetyltransferase [Flavobacteriales bacterium]